MPTKEAGGADEMRSQLPGFFRFALAQRHPAQRSHGPNRIIGRQRIRDLEALLKIRSGDFRVGLRQLE